MSGTAVWNNEILEPVLITYNRADHLERTLKTFFDAGLTSMRLHVLDNASTDRTPQVVRAFQQVWSELQYRRNKYNIGGNANILRAVEFANSTYNWIIGDDDSWHLEHVPELISVLAANRADIVRLGWLVSDAARGRLSEARALAREEALFFASVSMISATIIRRSIVTQYLPLAYTNTGDAYPQLVPIMRAVEERGSSVYSLSRNLMTHTPNASPGYYFGDLEWYSSWFRCSRFLADRGLREKFIGEAARYATRHDPTPLKQFVWLIKVALNYKALGVDQGPYLCSMLAYGEGWRGRVFAVMMIYFCTPKWVARWLRITYLRIRKLPDRGLRHDRSRL